MKYFFLCAAIIFGGTRVHYEDYFHRNFEKANNILLKNDILINEVSKHYQNDPGIISSIVFPELIRYSMFRDYIETTTLDIVYVNTGEVDFSIGPFQMKPSFAERIEYYISDYDFFSAEIKTIFPYQESLKIHEKRRDRLERLKDLEKQLHYLNAFVKIMHYKYPELSRKDPEYQIRFISTAYNHDFEADRKDIKAFMKKNHFPVIRSGKKEFINYSDISYYWYTNYYLPQMNIN